MSFTLIYLIFFPFCFSSSFFMFAFAFNRNLSTFGDMPPPRLNFEVWFIAIQRRRHSSSFISHGMPFRSANGDEGCGSGYFVKKAKGTITNVHYPSFSVGAVSPRRRAVVNLTRLKRCLSISSNKPRRGVVIAKGQFVIRLSLHHRIHYLGLLSMKKKLLMWTRKCVLCHYATESIDLTLPRRTPGNYSAPNQIDTRSAAVNYLELLSCVPMEAPRLILMLIFCGLIAASPWWSWDFDSEQIRTNKPTLQPLQTVYHWLWRTEQSF